MPHLRRVVACTLLGLALAAAPLLAAPRIVSAATTTFTVTTGSDPSSNTACPATPGNPCSLRTALAAADALSTGNTVVIDFAPSVTTVSLTQNQLVVNGGETLTIQGATPGSTVIDSGGHFRFLSIGAVLSAGSFTCPTHISTVTLSHLTIENGSDGTSPPNDGFGGAIDVTCAATLSVIDSTVKASSAQQGGGGIVDNSTATLTVLRSTIAGNTSNANGGGIDLFGGARLAVIDSTLTGNTAKNLGGGAIFAATGAGATLVNDTITANSDTQSPLPPTASGGIFADANASFTVANTIVSANTPVNCQGTVTDSGNNLDDGTTCGFSNHAIKADPRLDALKDNGGPTQTMALKPGSPAIDAGADSVCAADPTAATPGAGRLDQRGVTRPQGTHCDIGAFEVVATTTTLSAPATATAGGAVTLTATVAPAQPIPGQPSGTVTFLDGSSVLGTGTLSGANPDTASFSTSSLSSSTHSLTARFEQTPLFLTSTSQPATLTVAPAAAPSPGLISAPNTGAAPPAPGAGLLAAGALLAGAGLLRRRRRTR